MCFTCRVLMGKGVVCPLLPSELASASVAFMHCGH